MYASRNGFNVPSGSWQKRRLIASTRTNESRQLKHSIQVHGMHMHRGVGKSRLPGGDGNQEQTKAMTIPDKVETISSDKKFGWINFVLVP